MPNAYDVFLSHNSEDKSTVREIARRLVNERLKVWFDEWDLTPGRPWQEEVENALSTVSSIAVLIGENGLGRWERPEMRVALSESAQRGIVVIPVLLPGGPAADMLPQFLRAYTCVDMRRGIDESALFHLQCGIAGVPPGMLGNDPDTNIEDFKSSRIYYFCYISAFKLEQFIAQVPTSTLDAEPDNNKVDPDEKLNPLIQILSSARTYGHSAKRESERGRHLYLVEKLTFLLRQLHCINRIGHIDDYITGKARGPDVFYMRCPLRVAQHDNHMALLETADDAFRIELSCSLRYFSEYSDPSIPFAVHSGNYHFFQGAATPTFDAVVVPIELQESQLLATPLFLAINSSSGLVL